MNEKIKARLYDNEHVLWEGKPEPFRNLDATNRKSFFLSLIVSCLISFGLIAVIVSVNIKSGTTLNYVGIAFFLLSAVMVPILRLRNGATLRKCQYTVTDRRLIVTGDIPRYMDLKRIGSASLRKDADGHTSLLCGTKGVASSPSKWRSICLYGDPDEAENTDTPCESFGFYAVNDADGLERALSGILQLS